MVAKLLFSQEQFWVYFVSSKDWLILVREKNKKSPLNSFFLALPQFKIDVAFRHTLQEALKSQYRKKLYPLLVIYRTV
jgi:hypothetical protein